MELLMQSQMRKSIWLSLRQSLTGLLLKRRLLAYKLSETFSSPKVVLATSMPSFEHASVEVLRLYWQSFMFMTKRWENGLGDILTLLMLISGMSLWLLSVSILFMRAQSTLQGFGNLDIQYR